MAGTGAPKKILEVSHLKKTFNAGKSNEVTAVDDISFCIYEGETFGLVGESGCGKSTTGKTIIRLYDPTSGSILFEGEDVSKIRQRDTLLHFRRQVQMIFQDPYASLDPRMKVKDIISEGIKVHSLAKTKDELEGQVEELLALVGLNASHANRYPHEFSGGQRQRIGIARALAIQPKFIICDEPISALDVSIQAQVVNLLQELQEKRHLTYLFIAHDLALVKRISNRIGVMYRGKLVELGPSEEIYSYGVHPYTESLLSAIPVADPDYGKTHRRIVYHPEPDVKGEQMALRQIAQDHYVYCKQSDRGFYQEKLEQKKL
ncbi:MAG: ATP-binding cassette domain-containing protein [Christensenellaceae bacterium]|jgi:oligopeptide transport system ATP-binding protein|nr:ATP-binding cassette domain-containing protein [Christensenellaceae bacterium]